MQGISRFGDYGAVILKFVLWFWYLLPMLPTFAPVTLHTPQNAPWSTHVDTYESD